MKVTAIVPSYKPDEKLAGVLRDLTAAGFERIIVVDDGSGPDYEAYFRQAEGYPQCVLLRHEVNRGKGGALKTAFAWFLEHHGEDLGVVTVDGDGQHTAADALRCARELEAHPDSLVLGVRQFDGADVPLRSRIGNQATIWCFRVLCGVGVSDTQTGLRAIGTDFLRALCTVPGDRYEFETNMLLATSRLGIPIREVPIRTVYLEQNATSHFNPLRDSLAIYRQIFRFLSVSLGSTVLDVALFALMDWLLRGFSAELRLLGATVIARACSSLCNFAANRTLVFENREHPVLPWCVTTCSALSRPLPAMAGSICSRRCWGCPRWLPRSSPIPCSSLPASRSSAAGSLP